MNKMAVSEIIRNHQVLMSRKDAEAVASSGYAYLLSVDNLRQVRKCRTPLTNRGCFIHTACEGCPENRNTKKETADEQE